MENIENLGSTYNKLVSQEITEDDDHLYTNQNERVSMSTFRPTSRLNHCKVLTVSLTVLAVILLGVNIGLGIHYNKLTNNKIVTDIGNELTKLQASCDAAIQTRDSARMQLEKESGKSEFLIWEMDHQVRRNNDYEKQAEKMQMQIAALQSHLPMIKDGCRYCSTGWTFLNSKCYFLSFSETSLRMNWLDARHSCQRQGGDLLVINSREEHLALTDLINTNYDRSRSLSENGYWIGLTDIEEEGIWKWIDGTTLTEGYWEEGETTEPGSLDCAAVYPKPNPFGVWKDVSCSYHLQWICEMRPKSS